MSLSPESNTEVPTPIMTDLQDIASMIQINEEATVSRTVMHAEGVRLVLFSFDKDEILSEHTAAMPVILHTLEGALEIEADGRTVVLKPGDVIHELAMRPDTIAEEPATEIRRALARAINVNARPLTVADWRRALEEVGLVVEETRIAPMALLKPGRMIADEGVRGALRIMRNVARDKDLRERVTTMARTFKKYDRHLCGVAIVARKPKESQ